MKIEMIVKNHEELEKETDKILKKYGVRVNKYNLEETLTFIQLINGDEIIIKIDTV